MVIVLSRQFEGDKNLSINIGLGIIFITPLSVYKNTSDSDKSDTIVCVQDTNQSTTFYKYSDSRSRSVVPSKSRY